jgi:hypothetical protein
VPFGKYVKAAQAKWAERAHSGLRGKAGRGWAGIRGKIISEKNLNFQIYKGFGNLHKEI